ncbi:MAG TPA: phosphohydrolase, partial [Bacillales bacterium]|nr:phosphohydrolase [Bacillales bacterium]
MRIKRQMLKPGCVLADDVYANTHRPIMSKGTALTELHLQVLAAFFIEEIMIEGKTVDGKEIQDLEKNHTGANLHSSFVEHYLSVVKGYQQCFSVWQSGERMDIFKLRKHLIPLIEEAIQQPDEIFSLHHYVVNTDYLYHHAVSTSIFSAFLAKKLGYEKGDWVQIGLAGALCDAGMAKVSTSFLKHTGPPT